MNEYANEPGNPCYEHDAEFIEETHYCVINCKEFRESEMLFIPSQHEWVHLDEVDEYLQMHYINSELCVYNRIKNEVDKLMLITKR